MLFPETIIQRYQIRIHKRNEFLNGVTVPALATSKKKKKKRLLSSQNPNFFLGLRHHSPSSITQE